MINLVWLLYRLMLPCAFANFWAAYYAAMYNFQAIALFNMVFGLYCLWLFTKRPW